MNKVFQIDGLQNVATLHVHNKNEYANYVTAMCTKNNLLFAAGHGLIRVSIIIIVFF